MAVVLTAGLIKFNRKKYQYNYFKNILYISKNK